METIGSQNLWSLLSDSTEAETVSCLKVRKDRGHLVRSYVELAKKIAELQFRNRDHVLLFRGQGQDFKSGRNLSSLRPTLFRPLSGNHEVTPVHVRRRFDQLLRAEQLLLRAYSKAKLEGVDRLRRHQIIRWAILQHYRICRTPLLDVTQSLRIAASFASEDAGRYAFIMVLGVPNLSGAVTASDEGGLQIVRLSSACPPSAVRPHIQEGFLLGEYPGVVGHVQAKEYKQYEMDFGRRLVAKFRFNPDHFWNEDDAFPMIEEEALYPDEHDPLADIADDIKTQIRNGE